MQVLNLVFLSSMMCASRIALVITKVVLFLFTLEVQTACQVLAVSQTVGRASLWCWSIPRFRLVS